MKPSFIKNQDTISCTSGSGCSCANSRSTRIIFMASLTASLRLDVGGEGGASGGSNASGGSGGSGRGEVAASTKREEKEGTWSQVLFLKKEGSEFFWYIHFCKSVSMSLILTCGCMMIYNICIYIYMIYAYEKYMHMFVYIYTWWLHVSMYCRYANKCVCTVICKSNTVFGVFVDVSIYMCT